MSLLQDSTGYYLEPTTGQYYSEYIAPAPVYDPFGMVGGRIGMNSGAPAWSIMANQQPQAPEGLTTFGNKQYVPFTGNVAGISQGKRSVVDSGVGGRSPFQYNVPSLASMFPSLQDQMQAPMQNNNMQAPSAGAGRFMGGLLGSMPTPVSTTTTQAPASSGAGRFL